MAVSLTGPAIVQTLKAIADADHPKPPGTPPTVEEFLRLAEAAGVRPQAEFLLRMSLLDLLKAFSVGDLVELNRLGRGGE